jgi:hypothetical protein
MPIGHRVNNDDWRAADAVIPVGEAYCAVVVAAVATFGFMTSVGDLAESGALTMTVLVEVEVRPALSVAT